MKFDHDALLALDCYSRTYKAVTEAMVMVRSYDGRTEEMADLTAHVQRLLLADILRILNPAKEIP